MTRLVRFSNNSLSRLAANITNADTSISLTPGDGAKFPVISGSQFFMATLLKADGTIEIVKVTARSGDTLTVVRAAEPVGSTQVAYAFTAGDRIEQRLTAKALSDELDRLDSGANIGTANKTANYTVLANDVSNLIRVDTTSGTITVTLPQISSLTDDFDIMVAKVTGDANPLNVVRAGTTDLINGATSYTIYNQWQSAWLIADRSTNTWTVISSGISAVNTVVDAGTGSGSATITLSGDPGSKNNTALFIGGVYQQKSTYSISGTTLTAGGAITSGVGYEVVWSAPLTVGTPSDGTVTTNKLADGALAATTTGLAKMADGFLQATTAGLAKMADGFLAATTAGRAKMADLFITTAKLADAAVTQAKLGANVAGNGPAFSAYANATTTISSGYTPTRVALQIEEFDNGSAFNNTASTVTLNGLSVPAYSFCPNVAGYYQISCGFELSSTKSCLIAIFKNGSPYKHGTTVINSTNEYNSSVSMSALVYLNGSGDYVQLYAQSVVASVVNGASDVTYLQGSLVRAA